KKNVIVLERTDEAMAGDNPMGRDIRTALNKALRTSDHPATSGLPAITVEQMPRLFSGIYGCGSRDFRPEQVFGAYDFATGARARTDGKRASDGISFMVLGVDHPYEVKSDETPSLLPEGAVAVRFHSIGGWGAITKKSFTSARIPSTARRRKALPPRTSWLQPRKESASIVIFVM